jgi:hypothetical protein
MGTPIDVGAILARLEAAEAEIERLKNRLARGDPMTMRFGPREPFEGPHDVVRMQPTIMPRQPSNPLFTILNQDHSLPDPGSKIVEWGTPDWLKAVGNVPAAGARKLMTMLDEPSDDPE